MSSVRAKFVVNSITRSKGQFSSSHESGEVWEVKLFPVAASVDASAEDRRFWASTPTGSIEMRTVNPDAAQVFLDQLGKKVYVDFSPAPD